MGTLRRFVLALALGAFAAGCPETEPPTRRPQHTSASASAPVHGLGAPKRPPGELSFVRTGERCEVFYEHDGNREILEEVACPPEMRVGHRIRLTGRACVLEAPTIPGGRPVVCPDPLTNAEVELDPVRRPQPTSAPSSSAGAPRSGDAAGTTD